MGRDRNLKWDDHTGAINWMGVLACQSGNLQEGITFYQHKVKILDMVASLNIDYDGYGLSALLKAD